MSVKEQVKQNLIFYNLWIDVTEISIPGEVLLEGVPKEPLLLDETSSQLPTPAVKEIVLPLTIKEQLTPRRLDYIFNELLKERGEIPQRIVAGVVNDDSTVVFYFIHRGIYKPKKN